MILYSNQTINDIYISTLQRFKQDGPFDSLIIPMPKLTTQQTDELLRNIPQSCRASFLDSMSVEEYDSLDDLEQIIRSATVDAVHYHLGDDDEDDDDGGMSFDDDEEEDVVG